MRLHLPRRPVVVAAALGIAALGAVFFAQTPSMAQDLNLNEILRCGATDDAGKAACGHARDFILANCTVCHTVAPIVLQQFDEHGWRGLLSRHQDRVAILTNEELEKIGAYLAANFNESQDPPELPAALLKAWTDY